MKNFITLFLSLFLSSQLFAQGFEGKIYFTYKTLVDTSYYAYTVKGNKVRIDNYKGDMKTNSGTMLVDTKDKKMIVLNAERNIYMNRKYKPEVARKNEFEVYKTELKKVVNGIECTQWRVRDRSKNTEISYWVTEGDYQFLLPLLKTLNRVDNFAVYYPQIPGADNMFPMLAEDRDLTRSSKESLKVLKIERFTPEDSVFDIPKGYVQLQN